MVRINNRHFHEAYEYIKEDAADSNSSCIVFVSATDVDSLCAVRLLQAILKSDFIQHRIVPIADPQDLETANQKLIAGDDELRSVIMINCGGTEDINNLLTLNDSAKVYIIDSHRPLNLDNLVPETDHVCVFTDELETAKLNTYIDAFKRTTSYDSDDNLYSSGDMSDEDLEDDYGRVRNPRITKRRRYNDRDHISLTSNQRSERRRLNILLTNYFASGYYYANSAAGTIYELAQQLGKTNNELLWLAIVGVTSQYIFEKIDTSRYNSYVQEFRTERTRLNIDYTNEEGQNQSQQQHASFSIQAEDEYRFLMFRHWSLYESMYYSGYVATKLAVWKDDGKKRLNHMFARMGFSLQQCQQIFTHMDMDLKQQLKDKIAAIAPMYGLTDMCFPSFTRNYGYECCLSASDVVHALSTLLETSPTAITRFKGTFDWEDKDTVWGPKSEDIVADNRAVKSSRQNWWMKNFYTAYDALTGSSADKIKQGLQLCMQTQKVIIDQGTDLFEKRGVKTINRCYRGVTLEQHTPDISIFQHPSSVRKLALFITEAFREHGTRNLPILVAVADEIENTSLVIGISGAPTFGETRKNKFSLAYAETAEKMHAKFSQDSFDVEVIQIHNDDLQPFLRNMKYPTGK
ncbi:DNA replication pre-initiation complex subunit Cdc45 [Mycotypha africana]|uniref:DNA replication pre-initiation complex subunit Cdc45 n=1 Tax=Mycotypha africana TaxID=64632 RepID=UPI002301D678|nr:DNA replication pre-initiation complex subunit Cdc45 [Mycotypha africana]KAI8969151.1 DNA replication pre-initiation complex subunit Cdc45 [Mycotypha africana]